MISASTGWTLARGGERGPHSAVKTTSDITRGLVSAHRVAAQSAGVAAVRRADEALRRTSVICGLKGSGPAAGDRQGGEAPGSG
jgi:hypothetical protein